MRGRLVTFSFAYFCEYGQISGRLYESYLNRLEQILNHVRPIKPEDAERDGNQHHEDEDSKFMNVHYALKIIQGL